MKKIAIVDQSRCVACGVCVRACPRGALSIWRGCYVDVNRDTCVGCGLCAKACPAGCIAVTQREAAGGKQA